MIHSSSEFDLFDLGNNKKISVAALRRLLPDIETTLFFGKVYKLDAQKLGQLLKLTHGGSVLDALLGDRARPYIPAHARNRQPSAIRARHSPRTSL